MNARHPPEAEPVGNVTPKNHTMEPGMAKESSRASGARILTAVAKKGDQAVNAETQSLERTTCNVGRHGDGPSALVLHLSTFFKHWSANTHARTKDKQQYKQEQQYQEQQQHTAPEEAPAHSKQHQGQGSSKCARWAATVLSLHEGHDGAPSLPTGLQTWLMNMVRYTSRRSAGPFTSKLRNNTFARNSAIASSTGSFTSSAPARGRSGKTGQGNDPHMHIQ
jgi:hypothetical protein